MWNLSLEVRSCRCWSNTFSTAYLTQGGGPRTRIPMTLCVLCCTSCLVGYDAVGIWAWHTHGLCLGGLADAGVSTWTRALPAALVARWLKDPRTRVVHALQVMGTAAEYMYRERGTYTKVPRTRYMCICTANAVHIHRNRERGTDIAVVGANPQKSAAPGGDYR